MPIKFFASLALIINVQNLAHSDPSLFASNQLEYPRSHQNYNQIQTIRNKANAFLKLLSPEQKQVAIFTKKSLSDSPMKFQPEPTAGGVKILKSTIRSGLTAGDLNDVQTQSLRELMNEFLTPQGQNNVLAALKLEEDDSWSYRGFNKLLFQYSPMNYFVSFFGQPDAQNWSFRFEGHHISLTFTIDATNNIISVNPAFLGTTQKSVSLNSGDEEIAILQNTLNFTKEFLLTLNDDQKKLAIQSRLQENLPDAATWNCYVPIQKGLPKYDCKPVPVFNLFTPGIDGSPSKMTRPLPSGLSSRELSEFQKFNLIAILESYSKEHFNSNIELPSLKRISNGKISDLEFVWAGDFEMQEEFYFRIQGSDFVFEFNTSEADSAHYHAVWTKF